MDRLQASEWMQIAETELDRAGRFLSQHDVFAAYCLEQAVQASLFALLLQYGEVLERDVEYDLGELLSRASNRDREVRAREEMLRSVATLSDMARHPGRQAQRVDLQQTLQAIEAALQAMKPLVEHVRNTLSSEGE